ncbi:MAG: transposase [Bacteroidota bacterium]
MLIGYKPTLALSDFVRDVKANSSGFIHEKRLTPGRFEWQEGYGAFSYSHADLDHVINYIRKQEEHHLRRTFKEEYLQLLKDFSVEYDSRYLFEWMEET